MNGNYGIILPVSFRGFVCRLSDRFGLFYEEINSYCIFKCKTQDILL